MYSRFPSRREQPDEPIRAPKHYSGCVFAPQPPQASYTEQTFSQPRPSVSAPPLPLPPPGLTDAPPKDEKATSVSPLGDFSALSDSLGFEEILLIGLILLLARSEQKSDVVLWLALLLFCK